MRIEQDAVGLSVFLTALPDARVALVWALVGLAALVPGMGFTMLGWPLVGPALVFVGLGWFLTAHWLTVFTREVPCDHLRIDHLGVRANLTRLGPDAEVEEVERGVRIHDDRTYVLTVPDPEERVRLVALIRTGLVGSKGRWEAGQGVPGELRALLPMAPGEARPLGELHAVAAPPGVRRARVSATG
ncbi:MAG: hypothetical protein R3F61_02880 [Myxococcota bacterium]